VSLQLPKLAGLASVTAAFIFCVDCVIFRRSPMFPIGLKNGSVPPSYQQFYHWMKKFAKNPVKNSFFSEGLTLNYFLISWLTRKFRGVHFLLYWSIDLFNSRKFNSQDFSFQKSQNLDNFRLPFFRSIDCKGFFSTLFQ